MNEADEMEIDPDVVAAMGFTGFGSQPNKKRKFDRNDGFVDPDAVVTKYSTGANSIQTGRPRLQENMTTRDQAANVQTANRPTPATVSSHTASQLSLDAMRHGIRQENGDLAYFMPSFLEDPWAGLQPK